MTNSAGSKATPLVRPAGGEGDTGDALRPDKIRKARSAGAVNGAEGIAERRAAPLTAPSTVALLADPAMRIARTDGTSERLSLPALLAALESDCVAGYPDARPPHLDPWHAFLVQLAAVCLHRTGFALPVGEDRWREMLGAETAGHPHAWSLVAPHHEPAFLQPPLRADETIDGWDTESNPGSVDGTQTAREHDAKLGFIPSADPAAWVFAAVALQTTCGANGPKYRPTSRMNSGYGARLFVSHGGTPGGRFCRDVAILLAERNSVLDVGYAREGGVACTWVVPWPDTPGTSISVAALDPYYIDTPRRIRLKHSGAGIVARTTASPGQSRTGGAQFAGGITGDPWAPVDAAEAKIMTVKDLCYRTTARILTDPIVRPSMLQTIRPTDPEPLALRLSVRAGGQSKSDGWHERIIPVPPPVRGLLARRDPGLAEIANERIAILAKVARAITHALVAAQTDKPSKADYERLRPAADAWDAAQDSSFFPALWEELADDDRKATRSAWASALVQSGWDAVAQALPTLGVAPVRAWPARIAAERVYRSSTGGIV